MGGWPDAALFRAAGRLPLSAVLSLSLSSDRPQPDQAWLLRLALDREGYTESGAEGSRARRYRRKIGLDHKVGTGRAVETHHLVLSGAGRSERLAAGPSGCFRYPLCAAEHTQACPPRHARIRARRG